MLSVALGGGGCMRRRPTTARFGHVWVAKISKKMAFSALNPQIFSGQQAQFCGPLDTGAPAPDPCSDAHPRQPLRVVATQGHFLQVSYYLKWTLQWFLAYKPSSLRGG